MKRKHIAAIVALVLLLCTAVGGTLAWLVAGPKEVVNTFEPAEVTCWVDETFKDENGAKSNVSIRNTGDINAYIRAAIVVNWADEEGNISGTAPATDDYTLTLKSDTNWVKGSDGYYYYTQDVAPGDNTEVLIEKCEPVATAVVPSGYQLQVTIVAEAIQAEGVNSEGKTPVELAWGEDIAILLGLKQQGGGAG